MRRVQSPQSSLELPKKRSLNARGFTLIELLTVVAILGILSTIAVGSFTKNVQASYRTQVIADLSSLSLRQKALFAVRGHYATTVAGGAETATYPLKKSDLSAKAGSRLAWSPKDAGYTLASATHDKYTRGGGAEHGFDILNYMPEAGHSRCAYGSIAGDGSHGRYKDKPPSTGIAAEVFPTGSERFYARDWFYSFAYCDFNGDGKFWTFSAQHVTSKVHTGEKNWGG